MSYEVYGPYIVVVMLITFILLFAWVLHPKNKQKFDDAANLPFEDGEEADQRAAKAADDQDDETNNRRNQQ